MKFDRSENIYILMEGDIGRVLKWTLSGASGIIVAGGNGYGDNINQIGGARGMFFDQ